MRKRKIPLLVILIVGLAVFGFVYKMIYSPKDFVFSILLTLGIAFTILLLISFINNRRATTENKEMQRYKAALKQSQQKYRKSNTYYQAMHKPVKRKRKKPSHLTVIEGGKNNR